MRGVTTLILEPLMDHDPGLAMTESGPSLSAGLRGAREPRGVTRIKILSK